MRKKGIPEALLSLYKGARTKVKVGAHYPEELEANAGVHHGSALSPLLFATVVDVATNNIKESILQKIFCAYEIVLMVENYAELCETFYRWKSALESKGMKVNLMKTKVTVSKIGQVTVKLSSIKHPCGICGRRKQCYMKHYVYLVKI